MEIDAKTKQYDEAAIKHALRTKHIAVGRYDDDIIRVVVPDDNNGYAMLKYNEAKRLKCFDMNLRGIPRDENGKPLVSSRPATTDDLVDELKEVCKILGSGIPN